MNSVAIRTLSINEAIAEALKGWPAKTLARIVKTNIRTVENWKQAKTGPQVKHVAAMMTDDELCAALLRAFGQEKLARLKKLESALEGVAELEGK